MKLKAYDKEKNICNNPERREKHLEIKFYNGNQVEDQITWGLG